MTWQIDEISGFDLSPNEQWASAFAVYQFPDQIF
jgi:hypothetical protein